MRFLLPDFSDGYPSDIAFLIEVSARIIPAEAIRIKGKKVIEPMTKEDLTSTGLGCY
jgi:hypothetical protein